MRDQQMTSAAPSKLSWVEDGMVFSLQACKQCASTRLKLTPQQLTHACNASQTVTRYFSSSLLSLNSRKERCMCENPPVDRSRATVLEQILLGGCWCSHMTPTMHGGHAKCCRHQRVKFSCGTNNKHLIPKPQITLNDVLHPTPKMQPS